jgi:hypothetical protein
LTALDNTSRWILLGLLAAAVFVIFNCAGYLVITTFFIEPTFSNPTETGISTPQDVVSFVTTTPEAPGGEPSQAVLPTPIPLLPTVTPGPPPTTTPEAIAVSPTTPVQNKPLPATALPGQLEVLSHKSYIDSLGWYHIVGEVQNNSAQTMEFVEVVARLFDDNNEVIGTKLTFTAPDVIFPGSSAPFDIITLRRSQWQNIAFYRLETKGNATHEAKPQTLVLVSQTSQLKNDLLVVGGEIQNTGNSPALAKLIVTLYDADHNVINTGWSYADDGIIQANTSSAFEVKVPHQTDPNNFHYRIQIEAEGIDGDY